MRRIEHKQAEFTGRRAQEPGVRAEKIRQMNHAFDRSERVQHGRISGYQGADVDALRSQGDRKRSGHIGKLSNLDQGIDFGGDRKYAKGLHTLTLYTLTLSIIAFAVTQTSYSVQMIRSP
jgi:hypothetical protein